MPINILTIESCRTALEGYKGQNQRVLSRLAQCKALPREQQDQVCEDILRLRRSIRGISPFLAIEIIASVEDLVHDRRR